MHLTNRHARTASWIAVPLAVLASGGIIAGSSYAAFSSATETAPNSWSAGHVQLSNDHEATAVFSETDLAPGATGTGCVTVTADTTVDSTVHMYTKNANQTGDLAQYIGLTIERGTLTDPADCSSLTGSTPVYQGTLADLASKDSFGTGLGTWAPAAGGESSTYRISYTVSDATPNTAQDATADTTFVWEAQSD